MWKARELKKVKLFLVVLLLLLTFSACGLRDKPEPASDGGTDTERQAEGSKTDSEEPAETAETEMGPVAVADFTYLTMEVPLLNYSGDNKHAMNGEWLYYAVPTENEEDGMYFNHIARYRISDGFKEEGYIISEHPMENYRVIAMLADREGNCYLFSGPSRVRDGEDGDYYLEKYGTDGNLLWRTEFVSEDFQGNGVRLEQGTVTEDGRVFLCSYGGGGCVYAFGENGGLEEVYTPGLERLDGIAAGREGKVYGYCMAGAETVFVQLGEEHFYDASVVPLAVYDGYDEGLYLRTGEGLWRYVPEDEETEYLWGWEEAYVQVNNSTIQKLAKGEQGIVLMCMEQFQRLPTQREVWTFAVISSGDRENCPEKETITLAAMYPDNEFMTTVKRYNRQSRNYQVELVSYENGDAFLKDVLKGEASDLVNLNGLYWKELAAKGAFEDLSPYYEDSATVRWEDILEPVREACIISGRNVAVIPAFSIQGLMSREAISDEDWTIDRYLEMVRGGPVFKTQNPSYVFSYCMGVQYGDRFVDYEKKECYFDCEEFRNCLEACARAESYGEELFGAGASVPHMGGEEGWLLHIGEAGCVRDVVSWENELSIGQLIGYPGWEGAEYKLINKYMLAVNRKSENKEGAWDFLEYLMSGEGQAVLAATGVFPSRRDSFEVYLTDWYREPQYAYSMEGAIIGKGMFSDQVPTEQAFQEAVDRIRSMLDSLVISSLYGGARDPIFEIVEYEAAMYFEGDSTLDMTVEKIQNRVQNYLNEL